MTKKLLLKKLYTDTSTIAVNCHNYTPFSIIKCLQVFDSFMMEVPII